MGKSLWNEKRGLWGWKGFGKGKQWHTTVATCLLILNFFLLSAAFSSLFVFDPPATGSPRLIDGPPGVGFYVLIALTMASSAMSFQFLRDPEREARWGARALVSLVPAAGALLLVYFGSLIGR